MLDALSWSWERIKENPIPLIAGTGVWSVLRSGPIVGSCAFNGLDLAALGTSGGVFSIVSIFSSITLAHVGLCVAGGRKIGLVEFVRLPNLVQMVLAGLVLAVTISVGLALCVLPGVLVIYGFFFTQFIGVERGAGAIASMRQSWEILTENLDQLFPFALVGALLSFAGVVTVLGWLVTGPLVMLLTTYAYVLVTGRQVAG